MVVAGRRLLRLPPVVVQMMSPEFDLPALSANTADKPCSRDIIVFDAMLRAKPFPKDCPYEPQDAFRVLRPPELLRHTRAEQLALERHYAAALPDDAEPLLEIVGDGESRAARSRRVHAQAHVTVGSYHEARRRRRGGIAAARHALFTPGAQLPFDADSFGAAACHGCLPHVERPLALLGEIFRVLRPGGVACISWASDAALARLDAAREARQTAAAWSEAYDEAERLYVAASISRYSSPWARLRVEELPLEGAAGGIGGGLFVLSAYKPSSRELQRQRARRDVESQRSAYRGSSNWASSGGDEGTRAGQAPASREEDVPAPLVAEDAPAPLVGAISLQKAARAAREEAKNHLTGSDAGSVPARRAEEGVTELTGPEAVRAKILATMRRGIAKASSRSDLKVGEQKLLEHMKMYVVESKMAELDLTDEELQVWEKLKAEHTAAQRAAGEGSGGES